MRVLLAGSTGLIGAAVAERLRPHHSLHTLGRQASLVDEIVDLPDPVQTDQLRLPPVDCLVHCAGVIDEDFKADPMAAYRRATLGAEALLNTAVKSGSRRFIYVSSTHVLRRTGGEQNPRTRPGPAVALRAGAFLHRADLPPPSHELPSFLCDTATKRCLRPAGITRNLSSAGH